MIVTEFTPLASLAGGIMIGLAAVLLMLTTGRIAGVSGFVSRLLPPYSDDPFWVRVAFVMGIVVASILAARVFVPGLSHTVTGNTFLLIAAGALVGFGSVTGGGCTSGHGVCGLARRSSRSLVATLIFMAAGMATVFVMRHVFGG
jgi:uncharacterized protein